MDTVTIPKKEYERLKALDKVEWDVIQEYKQSLEELKQGKVTEC